MAIENISDTARWVAIYRAMETERPDAHFRDPFARRLAGEKGERIVATMKRGRRMAWPMVVRTQVFDEIILQRVAAGADLIINLAAGLDARPWRLALPPALRWVDVDLPDILNYKTETLRDAQPVCRYEAVAADLTDAAARTTLLARLGEGAANALVVTEGLLVYLTPEQVGTLARDLHAVPAFRWWLIDLGSPMLLKMMQRMWGKATSAGGAAFRFGPAEGTAFFQPFGWKEKEFRSTLEEGRRLRREPPGMGFWRIVGRLASKKKQDQWRRMSGVVLLESVVR
jgi:methyltransferase (TIGR00027 family)